MTQKLPPKAQARDPRAVANLLLDLADQRDLPIKHIKLQKLLYFAHCMHLMRTRAPLVSGYFEAWKRGPVHPAVYRSFRDFGAAPITARAMREDVLTGAHEIVPASTDPDAIDTATLILMSLGQMRDFDLVELSHAPGGPWDKAVEGMEDGLALGARIDENMIWSNFHRHKLVVRAHEEANTRDGGAGKVGAANVIEKPFSTADRTRQPIRQVPER